MAVGCRSRGRVVLYIASVGIKTALAFQVPNAVEGDIDGNFQLITPLWLQLSGLKNKGKEWFIKNIATITCNPLPLALIVLCDAKKKDPSTQI